MSDIFIFVLFISIATASVLSTFIFIVVIIIIIIIVRSIIIAIVVVSIIAFSWCFSVLFVIISVARIFSFMRDDFKWYVDFFYCFIPFLIKGYKDINSFQFF